MAQGVASNMRRTFGNTAQLRHRQKFVTDVASLEEEDKSIFYLINKKHY